MKGLALSDIIFERSLGVNFERSLGVEDHFRPAAGPSSHTPGERTEFAFQIINAGTHLTMRTRLLRDGAQVSESEAKPVEGGATKTGGRMLTHSAVEIPANLAPGEYLMRVEVEDAGPAASHARAWQWAHMSIREASVTEQSNR